MGDIWAVRGVPQDLRSRLLEHCRANKLTVGEALAGAIEAYLSAAPEGERVTVLERIARLEQRVFAADWAKQRAAREAAEKNNAKPSATSVRQPSDAS